MSKILCIIIGGACGALSRYWLSALVYAFFGKGFPWGTWAVNISGSFFFGLIWAVAADRHWFSPAVLLILLTGFMGSFTTFSTFVFESVALLRDGQWMHLLANVFGQTCLGLGAVLVGIRLGKWI